MSEPLQNLPCRWRWPALLFGGLVAVAALAPWWHNHAHLRDFYDYGLVVAANGRIAGGERPYVDFVTPIQSGLFWLNGAAERAFGGTFIAMTAGNALAIVVAALGLTLLLARRWPAGRAAVIAAAVVIGSLSQHTILWHNSLGVIGLAAVAWGCALAPVARGRSWPWHLLAVAGLLLGGVNKINAQLLALAVASGWALRELLAGRAGWIRFLATLGGIAVAGVIVPIVAELAWTGASFVEWRRNVLELPFASRARDLQRVVSWAGLWRPVHDYYGRLSLQPVGLLCLIVGVGAVGAGWRGAAREKLAAVAAGLLAVAGGFGLFASNYEIAYVALAAAVALGAGLWLGFGREPRGALFWATLGGPALLLVVAGGESAWRGQRSQFGHSTVARATYRDLGAAEPAFGYFSGLHLPAEVSDALPGLRRTLPAPDGAGRRSVFYGPGLEWLERAYPTVKHHGLPLWMHFGTSYGRAEIDRLLWLLGDAPELAGYYVAVPWRFMPPRVEALLEREFEYDLFSSFVGRWVRREVAQRPPSDTPVRPLAEVLGCADGIELLNRIGGRIDPLRLGVPGADLLLLPATAESGGVLGVAAGAGFLHLPGGVRSLEGEAVVRRTGANDQPVEARFALRRQATGTTLWSTRVPLAAGVQEAVVPIGSVGDGGPLELAVELRAADAGTAVAGFRRLMVIHADAAEGPPPRLRPMASVDAGVSTAEIRSWLPEGAWDLVAAVSRGVERGPEGLVFKPGAELWFKPDRSLASVAGEFSQLARTGDRQPVLRMVWCKGPRLELLVQEGLSSAAAKVSFRGWSPETDGWFGLLVDPGAETEPALVRFTQVEP